MKDYNKTILLQKETLKKLSKRDNLAKLMLFNKQDRPILNKNSSSAKLFFFLCVCVIINSFLIVSLYSNIVLL